MKSFGPTVSTYTKKLDKVNKRNFANISAKFSKKVVFFGEILYLYNKKCRYVIIYKSIVDRGFLTSLFYDNQPSSPPHPPAVFILFIWLNV